MRFEDPPEEWLVKVWDGEILVDLIHHPKGTRVDDALIERGEVMSVLGMEMRVMALEDVLVTKLMALDEHALRYESLLAISRALRERIDWDDVRSRTAGVHLGAGVLRHAGRPRHPCRGESVDRRSRDPRARVDASRFRRRKRGVGAQHMAEPITQARLRALSAVHPDQGRVLSVFLNLDPTSFATPAARSSAITSVMTAAAHKVDESEGLSHDERIGLRDDVERVRGVLEGSDIAQNGTRAVAVYACGAGGSARGRQAPPARRRTRSCSTAPRSSSRS